MIKKLMPSIALITASIFALGTAAASYPEQPIKLIVPYAAGGATDNTARAVATSMSKELGQTVVVENRPGANARIGTAALAKAQPDGYTFGMILSSHVANPFTGEPLPYDPVNDFEPVSYLSRMPGVMVISSDVPASNVSELRALVAKNPQDYFYAVPGGLTNGHVTMEMFKLATKLDITPVMFKGGAPASLEVAAGRVQMMIISPTAILPFVQDGRMKAIASTGAGSPIALPGLPSLKDSGVPDIETYEWVGMLAPVGTPSDRINRIAASVSNALKDPAVIKTLEASSMEIIDGDGKALRKHIAAELDKMRTLSATVKF